VVVLLALVTHGESDSPGYRTASALARIAGETRKGGSVLDFMTRRSQGAMHLQCKVARPWFADKILVPLTAAAPQPNHLPNAPHPGD
jgi:hypothetical protein